MVRATHDSDECYPLNAAPTLPPGDIASAWRRELPGVPTASIEVITPLWRAAKALADDHRRTLQRLGVEPATLDLLSTLRRAGAPYALTTREITERTLITAGAVSQRIARAERAGLVARANSAASPRAVAVVLTPAGHDLIEATVRDLLTHQEALVDSLSADERAQLGTLLKKLSDRTERRP